MCIRDSFGDGNARCCDMVHECLHLDTRPCLSRYIAVVHTLHLTYFACKHPAALYTWGTGAVVSRLCSHQHLSSTTSQDQPRGPRKGILFVLSVGSHTPATTADYYPAYFHSPYFIVSATPTFPTSFWTLPFKSSKLLIQMLVQVLLAFLEFLCLQVPG